MKTARHYVGHLTTKHHHLEVLRGGQVGVAAGEELSLGLRRHGGEMGGPRAVHELPEISDGILLLLLLLLVMMLMMMVMMMMMVLHFHRRRLERKKKRSERDKG